MCQPIAITPTSAHAQEKTDMSEMLKNFWLDDGGQDVPEYALMLALILIISIAAITTIGTNANTIFTNVGTAMGNAVSAG